MTGLTSRFELLIEHFPLQYKYAKRAAEVSNIPLEQTLMEFTQFGEEYMI